MLNEIDIKKVNKEYKEKVPNHTLKNKIKFKLKKILIKLYKVLD